MIEIHNMNGWEYVSSLRENSVDHIICDIVYGSSVNMRKLFRVCKGNIVLFDKPCRWFDPSPDKIYYWIKPSLPKNTVNQLSDPVEWMNVWRRGVYNYSSEKELRMQSGNYATVRYDLVEGVQLIPEQKPVSLMRWLIELLTEPSSTILDFMMGSGTTGEAAAITARNFIGCEMDKNRFEIAKKRFVNLGAKYDSLCR